MTKTQKVHYPIQKEGMGTCHDVLSLISSYKLIINIFNIFQIHQSNVRNDTFSTINKLLTRQYQIFGNTFH